MDKNVSNVVILGLKYDGVSLFVMSRQTIKMKTICM